MSLGIRRVYGEAKVPLAGVSDLSELTCVCSRRFTARVADRLTLGEVSLDPCPLLYVVMKLFDDWDVVG